MAPKTGRQVLEEKNIHLVITISEFAAIIYFKLVQAVSKFYYKLA